MYFSYLNSVDISRRFAAQYFDSSERVEESSSNERPLIAAEQWHISCHHKISLSTFLMTIFNLIKSCHVHTLFNAKLASFLFPLYLYSYLCTPFLMRSISFSQPFPLSYSMTYSLSFTHSFIDWLINLTVPVFFFLKRLFIRAKKKIFLTKIAKTFILTRIKFLFSTKNGTLKLLKLLCIFKNWYMIPLKLNLKHGNPNETAKTELTLS